LLIPAFDITAVDTTAAGDAFAAALAIRVAQHASMSDAVRFACAAGAVAASRAGAQPAMPTADEVESLASLSSRMRS
jgi:ribokinase